MKYASRRGTYHFPIFELRTSDFGLTSLLWLRISDNVRRNSERTSDVWLQNSEFWLLTLSFRLRTSNFRLKTGKTSDIVLGFQTSDFRCLMSDVWCPMCDVWCLTSDIRCLQLRDLSEISRGRGGGDFKFGFGNEVTHPYNGSEIC